jgi:hypothetical protein
MNIRLLLFFLIAFIPSVAGAICGLGGGRRLISSRRGGLP